MSIGSRSIEFMLLKATIAAILSSFMRCKDVGRYEDEAWGIVAKARCILTRYTFQCSEFEEYCNFG